MTNLTPTGLLACVLANNGLWPVNLAPTRLPAFVLANNGLWPRVILGVLTPGPDRCSDVVYLVSIPNYQ